MRVIKHILQVSVYIVVIPKCPNFPEYDNIIVLIFSYKHTYVIR